MKRLTALLVAGSTLIGAITALVKQIAEIKRDAAFAWDNAGDQVAEVERLKERLAALERSSCGAKTP